MVWSWGRDSETQLWVLPFLVLLTLFFFFFRLIGVWFLRFHPALKTELVNDLPFPLEHAITVLLITI